jgi:hypothetical protein
MDIRHLSHDPIHKFTNSPILRFASSGLNVAIVFGMIELPPQPDVPRPPDTIGHPHPSTMPVPPDDPGAAERPDIHPVPPPTDPGPVVI